MVKVAINGFGRIGRLALRKMIEQTDKFEVVAINDLTNSKTLAHLFRYDSAQGRFNGEIVVEENDFIVNGQKINVYAEKDPANLPWGELGVDVVLNVQVSSLTKRRQKLISEPEPEKWLFQPLQQEISRL